MKFESDVRGFILRFVSWFNSTTSTSPKIVACANLCRQTEARHDRGRQVDPPLAFTPGRRLEGRIGAAFPSSVRPEAEAALCGAPLLQVSCRGELLCGNDAADAQCHGFRVDDVDARDFAQGLWVAVGRYTPNHSCHGCIPIFMKFAYLTEATL
ncbi:hypothetical protein ZIOFF_002767 [Zingiber officinale]|uniref:Uncharacterized protein n=1 Tax=Zingiber officinale TaxID=94328 RepID=A0A8J5I046_ZINOF|nr:hypothetical protein ZIOFF_002767 [Zingiber officinale]